MLSPLDKKFAAFVKKHRGEQSYPVFAKKMGLSMSTIFRIERCEQSVTLKTVHQILERLNCTLADVFGEEF
ncbi:MAG: helix-turn-helix transcriptional regulator [Chthoniobacteraceae bacterium]